MLTFKGKQQASTAAAIVPHLTPPPELIIVSPLTRWGLRRHACAMPRLVFACIAMAEAWTCASNIATGLHTLRIVFARAHRALQTTELAFKGFDCKRIVSHWAAERLYHASDVRFLGLPRAAPHDCTLASYLHWVRITLHA